MYNDGRIASESSINDLPLSTSPHSGDMKRMSMRIAKIVSVDKTKNTVKLEWLWPQQGGIDNVNLSKPYVGLRSGINFIPEVGSIVIVGYAFNIPVILSYLTPTSYQKMLDGELDSNEIPTRMKEINPGEVLIYSQSGAEIYVHDQVEILDDSGNKITIDPGTNTIQLDSFNLNVINEAGNFYMGMVKRLVDGQAVVVTNDGKSILSTDGGLALTELTINIKEFADNTRNDNSKDPDIAVLTVGTLVDENGKKVLNEIGNQIVLDIKFSSGARIQADKQGNINLNQGKMTKPTQTVPPNSDPLSVKPNINFTPLLSAQHAAREGDFISIPVVSSTDADHPYMNQIAIANLAELASKLAPFFRVFGVYPCVYTSGPPVNLTGQIVTGSKDVFIGSKDEKI